jgi:hypothetical protein
MQAEQGMKPVNCRGLGFVGHHQKRADDRLGEQFLKHHDLIRHVLQILLPAGDDAIFGAEQIGASRVHCGLVFVRVVGLGFYFDEVKNVA